MRVQGLVCALATELCGYVQWGMSVARLQMVCGWCRPFGVVATGVQYPSVSFP